MAAGKVPSIRPSYASDAAYLVRLLSAVERDTRRDQPWRDKATAALQELVSLFSEAIADESQKEQDRSET